MLYFKSSWNTDKASDAFLGFSKGWNILRIAYAASFGTNETDVASNEIEECKNAIRHFDAISVREEEGVSICHKIFGVNAIKVLDPTMLLTKRIILPYFLISLKAHQISHSLQNTFWMKPLK